MKFFKLMKLIFLLLILNCDQHTNSSFELLQNAFFNWYEINHRNDLSLDGYDYDYFVNIYDVELFDEYIKDLQRFELELSQIDLIKLNSSNKINYFLIDDFIKRKILFNNILIYENYNGNLFIHDFYNRLYKIIENPEIMMYEKIDNIFSETENIFKTINKIKKNQRFKLHVKEKYFSNYEILLNYLDHIPVKVNSDNITLDSLDIIINKLKVELLDLKKNSNIIIYEEDIYDKSTYNELIDTRFNNFSDYNLITEHLSNDYQTIMFALFNVCIDKYLNENDEPVWVDRSDTLDVIAWTIDNVINKEVIANEKLLSAYYKNLNHILDLSKNIVFNYSDYILPSFILKDEELHLFDSNYYNSFKKIIITNNDQINLNTVYFINNSIIKNVLTGYYFDIISNLKSDRFRSSIVDKSYKLALSKILYKIFLDNNVFEHNDNYEIFYYLSLMRENVKAASQYYHFNNKKSKDELIDFIFQYSFLDKIASINVYNDIIKMNNIYINDYMLGKKLLNNYEKTNKRTYVSKFIKNGYITLDLLEKYFDE